MDRESQLVRRGISVQGNEDVVSRSGFLQTPASPPAEPANDPLPTRAMLIGLIAVVGILFAWFLASRTSPDAPVMEIVPQDRIAEAIPTLSGESQRLAIAKFNPCLYPLGFITVSTPGNPTGGTVSFRTSKYTSPTFHVTDKPQRIAIPNPLPETGGIDNFSVDGEAKGLIVSLYPTAMMQPVNGSKTIPVRFNPRPACKK